MPRNLTVTEGFRQVVERAEEIQRREYEAQRAYAGLTGALPPTPPIPAPPDVGLLQQLAQAAAQFETASAFANPSWVNGLTTASCYTWTGSNGSNYEACMAEPQPREIDWREREHHRQRDRKMPVWSNEWFWRAHADRNRNHFVHVCETDPELLSYTPSPMKGRQDVRTNIKPGRYLTKYFADLLPEKEIAFYAAWHAAGTRPPSEVGNLELKFARTPDEIADVYSRGPVSCMDGSHYMREDNPVRVYGAGDLAIAYLEGPPPPRAPDRTVLARALVWPEKKQASRVYPTPGKHKSDGYNSEVAHMDCHWALRDKLKAEGYKSREEGATLRGARLLRVKMDGRHWMMPYLDGGYSVDVAGTYWLIR